MMILKPQNHRLMSIDAIIPVPVFRFSVYDRISVSKNCVLLVIPELCQATATRNELTQIFCHVNNRKSEMYTGLR